MARYDLPLVQLLMAEFALRSCNVGSAGQMMRLRFLAAYSIDLDLARSREIEFRVLTYKVDNWARTS